MTFMTHETKKKNTAGLCLILFLGNSWMEAQLDEKHEMNQVNHKRIPGCTEAQRREKERNYKLSLTTWFTMLYPDDPLLLFYTENNHKNNQ